MNPTAMRDAKSRNGTLLDGKPLVGDHPLRRGERFTLGEGGPDLMVDHLVLPGLHPEQRAEVLPGLETQRTPGASRRGETRLRVPQPAAPHRQRAAAEGGWGGEFRPRRDAGPGLQRRLGMAQLLLTDPQPVARLAPARPA